MADSEAEVTANRPLSPHSLALSRCTLPEVALVTDAVMLVLPFGLPNSGPSRYCMNPVVSQLQRPECSSKVHLRSRRGCGLANVARVAC